MKLKQLLPGLETRTIPSHLDLNIQIQGIADNSVDVEAGFVFVAIKGLNNDGHDYIESAIETGASLVVGEIYSADFPIPYLQVADSRKALGILAKNFYGDPSKNKVMIGITGTNGKTTTSYILKHILESNGKSCSVIGTIENIVNGKKIKSLNTTPSSLALQKLLFSSQDEVIIMEVSSHGLSQYRVEGIEFDYCLFTNLHSEHLDYHHSMQEYFNVKLQLFSQLKAGGKAIVNMDNSWGTELASLLQKRGTEVYTIGQSAENHLKISNFNPDTSSAVVEKGNELHTVVSAISGMHNMYNTLLANMTAELIGISQDNIHQSIHQFKGVEGRFEVYPQANGSTVVIDYAHTADAISYCLTTVRQKGAQKIIHVFGFRGDRDPGKRSFMLSATTKLSDQYVLTFDDLNSVSPSDMAEILEHSQDTDGTDKGIIIPDRTDAIRQAMRNSGPGDWVVITGKGHEKYQQAYHMPTASDRETVNYISKLNESRNGLFE